MWISGFEVKVERGYTLLVGKMQMQCALWAVNDDARSSRCGPVARKSQVTD